MKDYQLSTKDRAIIAVDFIQKHVVDRIGTTTLAGITIQDALNKVMVKHIIEGDE